MSASLAAKMLAMTHDRMLAELAIAFRAVTGFIRHGTDSLGGGCLGLEGQAVIPSVGAAAGCDLLILFGIGGISVAAGVAAGGFALTASPFFKRQKGTKRLCPGVRHFAEAQCSLATVSIRGHRLRFASLHLLSMYAATPHGAARLTPG